MSYCRFSSDNWKSDVYCYESCYGGWQIHVAANRHVSDTPIPELPPITLDNCDEWTAAYKAQSMWLDNADSVPIGLEYDGQAMVANDPDECVDVLLMLREAGYYVPQSAIDALIEEANEGD